MNLSGALFHSIIANLIALTCATANANEQGAQAKYDNRAYSETGVANAEEAAQIYGELANSASATTEKHRFLVKQSEALYFVNDAKAYLLRLKWREQGQDADDLSGAKGVDKIIREAIIAGHDHGMNVAREVLKHYGIEDLTVEENLVIPGNLQNLSSLEKEIIAHAAYFEGINLAGKAVATWKIDLLPKWEILKSKMFLVLALGHESFTAFGAYRVLGRGYHKIPALFGGSLTKAEMYLRKSYNKGLVASQKTTLSGFTTLYLVDFLLEQKKVDEASDLAIVLVEADVFQLEPTLAVENVRAQTEVEHLF